MNKKPEEFLQRTAECELNDTASGSSEEKDVLSRLLREECANEAEEQIVVSVYLRRKQKSNIAAKKSLRTQHKTGANHERTTKTNKTPERGAKTRKRKPGTH